MPPRTADDVRVMGHSTWQLPLVGMSLLVASFAYAAGGVTLPSGSRLTISELEYNRTLPHSFYDQAMSSLPHLHPGYRLLASRRVGTLGGVLYALVCYRESPSSEHAVIQAVAVFRDRAWALDTTAPASYGDTLVEVLEQIAKLPSEHGAGTSRQGDARPRREPAAE